MTMISFVHDNPYRVLGILANASEKEIQRQISIIRRFTEVGKIKEFDYDFLFLDNFSRDLSSVNSAASILEQARNKISAGLFWFIKTSSIDEIALNHLKEKNTSKAREIWEKTLRNGSINEKNFSAANNLSTLLLALSTTSKRPISWKLFDEAIRLKGELLTSDSFKLFANSISGDGFAISQTEISTVFIDEILQRVKSDLDAPTDFAHLLSAFSNYPPELYNYLSNQFSNHPVASIESHIEEIKKQRAQNPKEANLLGNKLYNETQEDLKLLQTIWGKNTQYQQIINKLANEMLQCAIDFYNAHFESEKYDPGSKSYSLMKMVKKLSPTGMTKSRLEENIHNLEELIEEADNRQKYNKISTDFDFINQKLRQFQNLKPSLSIAKKLMNDCEPRLKEIKKVLGAQDPSYLEFSSAVVGNVQGMVVMVVNSELENSHTQGVTPNQFEILHFLEEASDIMKTLASFDMEAAIKEKLFSNKRSITILKDQISEACRQPQSQPIRKNHSKKKDNGGCLAWIIIGMIVIGLAVIAGYDSIVPSRSTISSSNNHVSQKKPSSPPLQLESKYKGNKLKNGTSPYNDFFGYGIYNKNHQNWLLFRNGNRTDAIVCLEDYQSGRTIRNEYIKAGTTFKMTNIPNGTYFMKVFSGNDWNPHKSLNDGRITGGFDSNVSFYQSKRTDDLIRLHDNGHKYSTGEITLYEVTNGNMQRQGIGEDQFF